MGHTYQDSHAVNWTYVADYDVGSGPSYPKHPPNYSAIDAATIVFGALTGGQTYAISTSSTAVDHLAWYDGWGNGSHLPTYNLYGGGVAVAEDFFADVGAVGYTQSGDFSAYVGNDRATLGGGAFNHVFVSEAEVAQAPEPASLALFGLGLSAVGAMRRKSRAGKRA